MARGQRHIDGAQADERRESLRRDEPVGPRNEHRDAALRTVERHQNVMDASAADNVDRLIRTDVRNDWTSRYIAAVGWGAYRSAFAKMRRTRSSAT
jgi:hypothetical protein